MEELLKIPEYAKVQELVTKKSSMNFETVKVCHS